MEKQTFRPFLMLSSPRPSFHSPIMEKLLLASMPPDEELVDLIEQAFVEGQTDGETQVLAFAWLERNQERLQ